MGINSEVLLLTYTTLSCISCVTGYLALPSVTLLYHMFIFLTICYLALPHSSSSDASGVASYGALRHVPLLQFWKRISLTVKTSKITRESFIHPFWRLINMFYIFVYLARNTRKLAQIDLNSLGTTKKSLVCGRRGKIHVVLPSPHFLATSMSDAFIKILPVH